MWWGISLLNPKDPVSHGSSHNSFLALAAGQHRVNQPMSSEFTSPYTIRVLSSSLTSSSGHFLCPSSLTHWSLISFCISLSHHKFFSEKLSTCKQNPFLSFVVCVTPRWEPGIKIQKTSVTGHGDSCLCGSPFPVC